ncbi:hypothetical protein GO730_23865 [Spirosoma sp. HMF3257]|uniref:Uncharacterized protein n=1 Tax=Spirosoma telluris TaxID=2183553 RepID=A0A327NUE5_9BACT|nr:hypothetical protein [Spirosoma telluris]RAI76428.1 hypothetical protein HMF3257_23805 [Spirosoma telluris]
MDRHSHNLKQQIEHVLNWEQSSHWRFRDFVHLSELIRTHTNQVVDANELAVFWQSSVVRSPFFLDTLAQFVDYADWEDFCTRNFYGIVEADEETRMLHAPMWEIPSRWVVVICWLSVIASVVVGVLLVWKH